MQIRIILKTNVSSGRTKSASRSETRKMKSPGWRTRILFGVTNVFLALVLIAGGFVMHSLLTVIYIYAGGLIYAGIVRIVTAFRRTSIVYIQ